MREVALYAIIDRVRTLCTPYTGREPLPDIYDAVAPRHPPQHAGGALAKSIIEEEIAELQTQLQRPEVAEIDSSVHEAVQRAISTIYSRLTEARIVAVPLECKCDD
jgi:hypothetical protein